METGRVAVIALLLLLPLGGLEARLIHLQLLDRANVVGDHFARRRSLDLAPAPRGRLLDRNGKVLARDEWAFDLHVVAEEFERRPEARPELERLLGVGPAELDESFERIYQRVEKLMSSRPERERPRIYTRERRTPYLLWKGVPREAAAAIETGGMERFPGLVIRESMRRTYPNGDIGAHVAGYLGRASANEREYDRLLAHLRGCFEELIGEDGVTLLHKRGLFQDLLVGRDGAEKSCEERLRGQPGLMILERDPTTGQKAWTELLPAVPGEDVKLTIDLDLQADVERILRETKTEAGEPALATAIISDPATGEILAMGSSATYDPNAFVPPTNSAAIRGYLADKERYPLASRAVQNAFQLGSIFKIVTSFAGLESGHVNRDTVLPCRGRYRENLSTTNCWIWNKERGQHGDVTLREALEQSCNCYYYRVGEDVGLGPMARWAGALGLGRRTGIDLPGEARGSVPDPATRARWTSQDSWSLSIGQHELTVSPVQVARMMCAVANGGTEVTPHVVLDAALPPPAPLQIPPAYLAAVREGLARAVLGDHGTARAEELRAVNAAGKTGSAQTSKRPDGTWKAPHAWFAGYAPADAPKYAIVVLVEHSGSGGHVAAPVAAKIATRLFKEAK